MTDATKSDSKPPFTHTAYFFIRTAMRKGRVYGYWKDGGKFRPDTGRDFFAYIDMVPRGGWDGRICFRPIGETPPEDQPDPQRPGEYESLDDDESGDGI